MEFLFQPHPAEKEADRLQVKRQREHDKRKLEAYLKRAAEIERARKDGTLTFDARGEAHTDG